jgi:hypothetical protein
MTADNENADCATDEAIFYNSAAADQALDYNYADNYVAGADNDEFLNALLHTLLFLKHKRI